MTALVTGAGSGIGRATARALAERGAQVICVDIDEAAAKTTADECGHSAVAMACDVADAEAVAELAERVHDDRGPLDVLVNNAGVGMTGRFADLDLDDWRWIRSINLDGVVHGCHAFGPAMVERGSGHIVNVSSGLGYTPTATESAYCTTKAAVLMLSQCLRADWGARGVGVSAICPGVINTPIIDATRFVGVDESSRARAQKLFRRGHKPDSVAKAVVSAVERDRPIVPVGWEAWLGWGAHRVVPSRIVALAGRQGPLR